MVVVVCRPRRPATSEGGAYTPVSEPATRTPGIGYLGFVTRIYIAEDNLRRFQYQIMHTTSTNTPEMGGTDI